jgi:FtsH-binding integral membrane protein
MLFLLAQPVLRSAHISAACLTLGKRDYSLMQNFSARLLVALAFIMSGTLLVTGSRIYGVLYLPQSEQLSVWPLWVIALAPITVGLVLLRRAIKTQSK